MTGTSMERQPNSNSPMISICREEKFWASGESGSMPGLSTTKSKLAASFSACGPQFTFTPRARRFSIVDLSSVSSGALSRTVASAPSLRSSNAAAVPLKPAPSTATFLPWYFTSSELESRQSEQRENGRQDPEPDDHGVFLPAAQFEMMMQRRHREDAFAGQPEAEHLEDDRGCFEDEDAAHDREQQLLFATNSDDANHAADGQRAGVAHDHFRGMVVEPEKAQARSDQRGANDRQLAGVGIKWDLEILGDAKIPGGVSEQCVGERDRDGATDGEPVETVREINGVRRTGDDEGEKDDREQAHVQDDGDLEERQVKRARLHFDQRIGQEDRGDDARERELGYQFDPAADSGGFFLGDLQVIIHETERAEIDHAEKRQPNETIVQACPDEAREHDRTDDEDAAHRRHTLFGAV